MNGISIIQKYKYLKSPLTLAEHKKGDLCDNPYECKYNLTTKTIDTNSKVNYEYTIHYLKMNFKRQGVLAKRVRPKEVFHHVQARSSFSSNSRTNECS